MPDNLRDNWTEDEWKRISVVYTAHVDYTAQVNEIRAIHVNLTGDPTNTGLTTFHKGLSEVQGFKSRISAIVSEVLADKAQWTTYASRLKEIYNTRKAEYLTREEITKLRNVELQVSACERLMPHVTQLRQYIDETLAYVNNVLQILQEKANDLESINSNLSRQISVVQMQIDTGEIKRAGY